MKFFFFLAVSLYFSNGLLSQEIDVSLSKKYSKLELEQIKQNEIAKFELISYATKNACYVIDSPEGKDVSNFGTIVLDSFTNINYLDLGLSIIENQNQYFRIEGTNQLLVVKSTWVLNYEISKN
jgi:hypothetical protein